MSYQVVITGHHQDDNDTVQQVASDAVRKLRAAGHTGVSASGYSYNGTVRVDITTPPEDAQETKTGQEEVSGG